MAHKKISSEKVEPKGCYFSLECIKKLLQDRRVVKSS